MLHSHITQYSYEGFIHLRVHSAYSLTEGAILMKKLPSICEKNAMPAMALTDTNNLFGALEFSLLMADKGIQPIIGCQLSFQLEASNIFAPLVLLVKNEIGYQNLLKLVSSAYFKENNVQGPYCTITELEQHHEGLICLTGGVNGLIGSLVQYEHGQGLTNYCESTKLLEFLIALFGDRLYLELQRHNLGIEKQLEPIFLKWAVHYKIPIVATNNVFFETPEYYEAHDSLLCIAAGTYIEENQRRTETPMHYFRSAAEMQDLFKDLPEAIYNTVLIAKRCAYRAVTRAPILPRFSCGMDRHEDEEIALQAKAGLQIRLVEEVFPLHPQEHHNELEVRYVNRLEYELNIIRTMGFSGYFLIVSDFIKWAKEQGIPVGPGRGSGAGSLVAWVLTITDMDPIRFNLIFERFLNPERVSMPDFDVDFCQDRRDEVIHYVSQKYGHDRVAHIITFGKFQARMVIRDVGRVLQMPYGQVDRICKMIPNNPANPVTLAEAIEADPLLQQQRDEDSTVEKLMKMGIQLEGLYRHASTHAAGIVIGDRPLNELVPLYRDDKSNLAVTQFNMKYVEAAGLVKFDFLGLKTLTVIESCCKLVRQKINKPFKIHSIPLDDPATFALLCRVEAVGIFQLESSGMRDVLRRLQPDRFEDLIALVALYRPGPMDDIPRYLACKHGQEPVTYAHPALEAILEPTYGVMVYQEQVMQIAQTLGGYTLGAADLLRRAMGKKIKSEMDAQRVLFTDGAVEKGVDPNIASLIFDLMAKFAGYGFNKSHSAPYALLAYQTAYLKANHPLEFFAASMTLDMQNTDKINVYIQDLDRLGIELLPPDINFSKSIFTVEEKTDGTKGIRYALSAIKNVGVGSMEFLVEEREKRGLYKDLNDFANRIDSRLINKRQLDNLAASGAFDSLLRQQFGVINRRQLFEGIDALLAIATHHKTQRNSKQKSLFSSAVQNDMHQVVLPKIMDWTPLDRLQKEFDALGFYLSAHPLNIYKEIIPTLNVVASCELSGLATASYTTVNLVGMILTKQERTSKKGEKFAFVQVTDLTGIYEVAFFSETYIAYRDVLTPGTAVFLSASLKIDGENTYRLIAKSLEPLDNKARMNNVEISMHIDKVNMTHIKEVLMTLKPGSSKLHFLVDIPNSGVLRMSLPNAYDITQNTKALFTQ